MIQLDKNKFSKHLTSFHNFSGYFIITKKYTKMFRECFKLRTIETKFSTQNGYLHVIKIGTLLLVLILYFFIITQ